MKKGFILLEVLIASAISTFILAMVTSAVYQTNNSFARMSKVSSIDIRALLVQYQMEKDLSGAFVPYERKEKPLRHADKSAAQDERKPEKAEQLKGKKSTESQKKQYESVPLKDAFLSKNKGNNLDVLTFVTSNPIPVYGSAKPLIARVVYTLVPDKVRGKEPPSFTLFRQEDKQLDFGTFKAKGQKGVRSYELIKKIKRMTVEYTVTVVKQAAKEKTTTRKTSEPKKEQKTEYKKSIQWTEKEIKGTKRQRPDFCVFKVELWDDLKKTYDDFEFSVYIFQGEQKIEEKKQEPKKTGTQKGTGQAGRQSRQTIGSAGGRRFVMRGS